MTASNNVLTNNASAILSTETDAQIQTSIDATLASVPSTEEIRAALPTLADPEDAISIADERDGMMMESAAATAAGFEHFMATGTVLPIPGFEDLYGHPMIGGPIYSDHAQRDAAFEAELEAECSALLARLTR